jgi:tetratricopeptide (TPR) repeat protein
MSLIHDALKKVERQQKGEVKKPVTTTQEESKPEKKRKTMRLALLIGCNVIIISYVGWMKWGYLLNTGSNDSNSAVTASVQAPASSNQSAEMSQIEALRQKAIEFYEAKQLRESRQQWEQVVLHDPLNPENYSNLGLVLKKLGMWKAAIKQYQKALQLDPEYSAVYNNLGVLYLARGDYEVAQRYLKKSAELDEKYADPHLNLGFLYETRGDPRRAWKEYKFFLEKSTNENDPIRTEVDKRMELLASVTEDGL